MADVDRWVVLRQFAAGGLTGAATKTITAPLERVKILKQVQGMSQQPGRYRGILSSLHMIYTESGVTGFFKGNGANVARVVPVHALKFGGNDFFKKCFAHVNHLSPTAQLMLAGTCAGLFQQSVTMPMEVVRTRLSVGAALKPPMLYQGIVHCAQTIVRKEGWRGLYKGLVATLWSGVPFVALQMTLYGVRFFTFYIIRYMCYVVY